MKRLAIILALLLASPAASLAAYFQAQTYLPSAPASNLRQENFFGLTGSAWQTPSTYYVPGTGNPAVSTSDYYQQDGVAWMTPTDLTSAACVAAGASTANGRYLWVSSADHASGNYVFAGNAGFRLGYSNDPGVLPSTMRLFYYPASVTALPTVATITADISNGSGGAGNILNVTAVTGAVSFDSNATVAGTGVTTATITAWSTGAKGRIGTYTINGTAQLVASRTMTVSQANFSMYQNPDFVCNPDDLTTPFYVYGEGSASSVQHEEGVIKSADLVTWTSPVPSHVTWTFSSFGSWSSYQRVVRDSAGVWHSTGFNSFYTNNNVFGSGKWTSADGLIWAPNLTTLFNVCLPPNTTGPAGKTFCPDSPATQLELSAGPDIFTVGAQTWTLGSNDFFATAGGSRSGTQSIVRAPIDSNYNVLASPSLVTYGTYGGSYPGPTFLQDGAGGYIEDGILHVYAKIGFPVSTSNNGLMGGATYANGGGLWQQKIDYYTEIIDASAAAGASPVGVKASCASSVASLTWFNALPTQTYRLYRGTSAGSQPTLVGDFTGTTATDSGMTLNAITYYKLVYLNGGIEQKNRVVNTWCSSSIYPEVNAHFTRASAGGADMTTCSQTFMDTFYAWLTSNGLKNNLLLATMPEFCVAKSGSVITKIFDMGTTRLPRGGDYTPLTANTAYNATGINSKPAWVNSTSTAYGVYGGGRLNNIQRKTQITLFAAYQKPNTNTITPFITGQFSNTITLQHASGTPGTINCLLADATQQKTATAPVTGLATDVHTASCTFDGTTWLGYSDAVAGSGQTGLVIPSPDLIPPDMLTGQVGLGDLNTVRVLASGGDGAFGNVTAGTYSISSNQAQYSGRAQMIFDKALTGAQETSLDALVR